MQTLGICPEKETRVLKERRITCVSRTSDLDHGLLYAVFLQNTPILWMRFPGRCPISANLFGIGATESCGVWVILTTQW